MSVSLSATYRVKYNSFPLLKTSFLALIGCAKTHVVSINHNSCYSCMLLKAVHFVMSYTSWQAIKWQRKPFLLYWMCLLNLLWCWISAEAWSVHIGLSVKCAPLYKSLTTLRSLYLCPAGEQEVLNLATTIKLWRLHLGWHTPTNS